MRYLKGLFLIVTAAFLGGCLQDAAPTTTQPSISISAPKASQTVYFITTYNSSLNVSGVCSPLTKDLQISADNGTTWMAPDSGDFSCTDGNFAFSMNDCSTLGFLLSDSGGTQRQIKLKSSGDFGPSQIGTVTIQLNSAFPTHLTRVGSGGGFMQGSQYKIHGRIGAPVSKTMTGANYKVHTVEEAQ